MSLALTLAMLAPDANAACTKDEPDCKCFDNTAPWSPSGSTIIEVAEDTLGTSESCRWAGGKPYYQMVVGFNDRNEAQNAADAGTIEVSRTNWCSESISYWAREAQVPGPDGFATDWHDNWQIGAASQIVAWFEEAEAHGDGIWIEPGTLDLENFEPGVNAPCPGAYQQYRNWTEEAAFGAGGGAHSELVADMTIYENQDGTVADFDLTVISGNHSDTVKYKDYTSVPRFTPQGSDWISSTRKLRGWGVFVGADGEPICDMDRVTVIRKGEHESPYSDWTPGKDNAEPDKERVVFGEALLEEGLDITQNGKTSSFQYLPGVEDTWKIPSSAFYKSWLDIEIDWPLPYPYEVAAIELRFHESYAPDALSIVGRDAKGNEVYAVAKESVDNHWLLAEFDEPVALDSLDLSFALYGGKGVIVEGVYLREDVEDDDIDVE